jgi:glycine cleavage system H protein
MVERVDLLYTREHEWVRAEGAVVTVGITAYASEKLGEVVFVDLPQVGSEVTVGQVVGEVESTKSVGELYAPVDGSVVEVNETVVDSPELVNSDPFGEGWLIKLRCEQLPPLLTYAEYSALVGCGV